MINQKFELQIHTDAYWLVFSGDRIVSFEQKPGMILSQWQALEFAHEYQDQIIQIGEHQSKPCYAVDMQSEQLDESQFSTFSLRSFFMHNDADLFNIVARAWQVVLFRRTHKFCGKCGSDTKQIDWEMAMQCHRCGHRCYPRISPCIIVAIQHQGKILLAQGPSQRERKMWSTLAGFVESGENLEQAVHREVFEEVGVKIKNLEYFGSQPWPFPHSLMVGYLADFDSGDIQVDGKEIIEAHWFDLNELPFVPPNLSIAGQLIEECMRRNSSHSASRNG